MINFDGEEMQKEFNRAFGHYFKYEPANYDGPKTQKFLDINNLTGEQLWWLVKFAKHIRGRCRNNAALNNYLNRNFPNANFREVPKEYKGKSYMGLKITINGQEFEQEPSEE